MTTFFGIVACTVAPVGFGSDGSQTELHGAGTVNDGGSDSGGDTAGSGDSDTGSETPSDCGGADLDFALVVGDGSNESGTYFSYGTSVVSTARFTNSCVGTVVFTTTTSCLVERWALSGPTAAEFAGNCVNEVSEWSIAEEDGVEIDADWGLLARGNWAVSATSAVDGRVETAYFVVE